MKEGLDYRAMLEVAIEEARLGLVEGGIPIRAALFGANGALLGRGHNRRVQENDPSVRGESRSFRGGIDWLRERGVEVVDLDSSECVNLLTGFIEAHPDLWDEDIGEA